MAQTQSGRQLEATMRQLLMQGAKDVIVILGVEAALELVEIAGQLVILIAQQRLPLGSEQHTPRQHVTLPETGQFGALLFNTISRSFPIHNLVTPD